MNNDKKPRRALKLIGIILLIIFLGFASGILGELFTKRYLSNWSYFRDLYFTENNTDMNQKQIIINDPRKVVVEEDLRLSQLAEDMQPQVVSIYKKTAISKNLIDNILLPSNYLGMASILTSDGWLITSQNTGVYVGSIAVTSNQKAYEIKRIINDPASGATFVKIDVQNLPVIKFADYSALLAGEHLAAFNALNGQIEPVFSLNKEYKELVSKYDFVFSSQDLSKKLLIDVRLSSSFKGAPIFNYQNEVVGIFVSDNKAIPIGYIKPIVADVLKSEKIVRPYLGIHYINISKAPGLDKTQTQNQENGALIWPNSAGVSVEADSPAYGKLLKNDIITSIESQSINSDRDLADIILEYKTGQEVRIKYFRDGKEAEMSLKLK